MVVLSPRPRPALRSLVTAVAALAALAGLAGCARWSRSAAAPPAAPAGPTTARTRIAPAATAEEPPASGVNPAALPALIGWRAATGVTVAVRGPLRFAAPGPLLGAAVVRTTWDRHEVALVFARLAGDRPVLVGQALLAVVPALPTDPRDVTVSLSRVALGRGVEALRVDVGTYQERPPHLFAIKAFVYSVAGTGAPQPLLSRLVEDGSDARDRHAVFLFTDLDGDGVNEIVVEETEAGRVGRSRRLVYIQTPEGVYGAREPSLFSDD
jgi:hypothetical protein